MSFLKRLFGLGGETSSDQPAASTEPVEHKGFTIQATPFKSDGQYQTCALVTKEVDGEVKQHRLVRADRFASLDDAVDVSHRKARQMIDEQGDRIFG
jgi:hypothetical protein